MSVGSMVFQMSLLVVQNRGNLRLLPELDHSGPVFLRSNHPISTSVRLQIVGICWYHFNKCAGTSKLKSVSAKSATTFQRLQLKSCSHMARLHPRHHLHTVDGFLAPSYDRSWCSWRFVLTRCQEQWVYYGAHEAISIHFLWCLWLLWPIDFVKKRWCPSFMSFNVVISLWMAAIGRFSRQLR